MAQSLILMTIPTVIELVSQCVNDLRRMMAAKIAEAKDIVSN